MAIMSVTRAKKASVLFQCLLLVWACFITTNYTAADKDPALTATVEKGVQAYNAKRYKEALDILVPEAIKGNYMAEFFVGVMHYIGQGTKANRVKGTEYLKSSANSGYYNSQLLMAQVEYGNQNSAQVNYWLDLVSKQTSGEALYQLGQTYFSNKVGKPNYPKGLQAFERALESGYIMAGTALGNIYINGIGIAKDIERGLKYMRQAAAQNDQYANFFLGKAYRDGTHVSKNRIKALNYFLVATESGSLEGAYELAKNYESGWQGGNKEDLREGMKWLQIIMAFPGVNNFSTYEKTFKSALKYARKSDLDESNRRAIAWYKETFDIEPPETIKAGKIRTVRCDVKANRQNPDCNWFYYTKYDGTAVFGIPHGMGDTEYYDGSYNGDFKAGERHGEGTFRKDNSTYVGTFRNNKKHGKGTLTRGKYRESGQFKNDYFSSGKVTNKRYRSGTYTGEWRNDKPNGKGKRVYSNGNVYEGVFKSGSRHGYGKFTWKEGDRYEGNYKDDIINGNGTYYWPSGNRYTGNFVNSKRSGKGTFYWSNGGRYTGDFVDGDRTGYGIEYFAGGGRHEGNFKDGKFIGQGTRYFSSGSYCRGRWNDQYVYDGRGKYNGRGNTVDCFWDSSKRTYTFRD